MSHRFGSALRPHIRRGNVWATLVGVGLLLLGVLPATAQPTFTNAVLPNGVPDGATGTNVVTSAPLFFDPASGDYRPEKPAGSPLVDLAGSDAPRDGRLLNGQTQTADGWDAGALESNGSALPVELTDLDAVLTDGPQGQDAVRLSWTTASETQNAGFRVQRQTGESPDDSWITLDQVDGAGTTSRPRSYRFVDTDPPFATGRLRYRLLQVDTDGATNTSDPVVLERSAPQRVEMRPPAPNPAQAETTVKFALPEDRPSGEARLAVFDVLGREVTRRPLDPRAGSRGTVRFDVSEWPSGHYFVRLTVGQTTRTKRLTVVR